MIHKHYRYLIVIMSLLSNNYSHLKARILLPGNSDSQDQSFTFNIGAHAFHTPTSFFFIGSKDVGAKDYALSFAANNAITKKLSFHPMAPSEIVLNLSKDADGKLMGLANPLYDAQIQLLTTFGSSILTTQAAQPSVVYLLENFATTQPNLTVSAPFNDSNGEPAKAVIALETQTAQAIGSPSDNDAPLGFFAAVTNQQDTFDGNGSGISYAFLQEERNQHTQNILNSSIIIADAQIDPERVIIRRNIVTSTQPEIVVVQNEKAASTTSLDKTSEGVRSGDTQEEPQKELPTNNGNLARAIELNEPALTIGANLLSIDRAVSMSWNSLLQKLYVGLQVQAAEGARGVLLASVVNGVINFQQIAPDSVFADGEAIIGTSVPGNFVTIQKVSTLQTSTYLTYLIVVGGTGASAIANNTVYAMPLVQAPEFPDGRHGTLANVNSVPTVEYSQAPHLRFQGRRFTAQATAPNELFTTSSIEAQVGAGPAPAPITDMIAFKDTVFISTQAVGAGSQEPGIFYSQALFDDLARIKGWTAWQRTGTTGPLAGFSFGAKSGDFYTLPISNGTTHSGVITSWGNGSNPLEAFIGEKFPRKIGGVQGLFDFGFTTSGFSTSIGSRIAVTALTGYKKIMLLQSGSDSSGIFTAIDSSATPTLFQNTQGTLSGFGSSAQAIEISGGVIDSLKAIVSAEFVTDGIHGWWVVGGVGGLAVLARADGTGVIEPVGLQSGFAGLTSDMSFIKISSKKLVRKLISLDNALYVLTPYSLERIVLTPQGIANNSCSRTLLASTGKLKLHGGSFADMAISGPLALLASSVGLFRSGNGVSIATADDQSAVNWTPVLLGEVAGSLPGDKMPVGPITQLFTISPTVNTKEWYSNDRGIAGNIYVLNADVGYTQAQVYRLNLNAGPISDMSVVSFPDYFVRKKKSFFVNLTDYRNGIQTDGAVFIVGRSAYLDNPPYISLLSDALRASQINGGGVKSTNPVWREKEYTSLGRVIRLSALGGWAVNGDFGIRLHN